MQDNINDHIASIEAKLKTLIKNYQVLTRENTRLKSQLEEKEKENNHHKSSNENLVQQLNILKSSSGTLMGEEKARFEKSINQYIKAIEHCIAHLNK
ncbi:MAG: hypothetical protein JSS98_19000 [Bacteroidetes bacterium]|nr:hypothetical protein [Bacteroidota bacterium]